MFSFKILHPFQNLTKALKVNCGEPKCGQAVNQGNSPFARFDLGNDYKRPDSSASAEVRIVGGQDSRPTKWPFMVSLHRDGLFKCGAVIINKDWILTAAHCVGAFDTIEISHNSLFFLRKDLFSSCVRTMF